jgi:hypothetical protein
MREAGPVTETLKMVATSYRTAYAVDASPTKRVAEAFEVPRATEFVKMVETSRSQWV